jgi:hypothetical protein
MRSRPDPPANEQKQPDIAPAPEVLGLDEIAVFGTEICDRDFDSWFDF